MSDPHDHYHDDFDDGDCWNCGGEGRVNHCIDGCCVDTDDIYCDYCSKRCDVCQPVKPNPELQQILKDALDEASAIVPHDEGAHD
ncbi:hypothetical protein [Tardiphaga sp. 367_B4_N1_1]|uniref:hypothetical protein n=1 Tax=Tardiphaga sp. 367_B4_N1_1 TaxID=3240777 RepID=UPI003F1F0504